MKIQSVRVRHLHHEDARLVEDGTTPPLAPGSRGRRQMAVAIGTDEGVTGVAVGYAPPGGLQVVEQALAPALIGQDPTIVGELWAEMMWTVRDFGRGGVALQAVSAVDLALWDLNGRAEDRPLCDMLGRLRSDVVAYGSGGFTSFSEAGLVTELRGFLAEGFRAVKMKVGKGFGTFEDEDLARVGMVREAAGPDVEIYVDANGAYGVEQAIRMAGQFADLGVRLFEEPVPPQDVAALAAVRAGSAIPIAAGEHEYETAGLRRMAEVGAVDVLQPDVLRIGGVSGWLQAASVAAEYDLPLMSHAAQLSSLQLGCATPGFAALEYLRIQEEMDRLWYKEIPRPQGGRLAPFDGRPGLGLDIREELFAD